MQPGAMPEQSAKKVTHCPAAHTLRPWAARAGTCDACQRQVREGEMVMDCRQCNWYLCRSCRPPLPQDDSIWNSLAGLMDNVAKDVTDMAAEIGLEKLVTANNTKLRNTDEYGSANADLAACEFDEEGVSAVRKERAERAVADFCARHPPLRVEPNGEELSQLLATLSELPQGTAARAFSAQLSWEESEEWQPKLRALHALEYLYWQDGFGREIAEAVQGSPKAKALIEHLEGVLQCKDQAARTLLALSGEADSKAAPSKWRVASQAMPRPAADLLDLDLIDLCEPAASGKVPAEAARPARNVARGGA